MSLPLSAATKIASYQLLPPNGAAIEVAQAAHRIHLLNAWGAVIRPGSHVLEIGCGQGNCTAVLAEAVGADGHVDAVDPAPPDYGAPFTLAEAQAHLSQSAVGGRIAWHRDVPNRRERWDVAVLAHCVWYFASPDDLLLILRELTGRAAKVCVAEYALRASETLAVPHVLAAIARGTLEAHKPEGKSTQNIRTLLSPEAIKDVGKKVGWQADSEGMVVPDEGLQDGYWEVGAVVNQGFLQEIEQHIDDKRVKVVLKSARASVLAAVDAAGGVKKTRTMDVWTGVFSTGL